MKKNIFWAVLLFTQSVFGQDSLWIRQALSYPVLSDTLSDTYLLKANGLRAIVAKKGVNADSLLGFAKISKENFKNDGRKILLLLKREGYNTKNLNSKLDADNYKFEDTPIFIGECAELFSGVKIFSGNVSEN